MNAYTHGHGTSVLRSHMWRTAANSAPHLVPQLRSGMSLLDIGAGPGTITADLAELVAPGRVTAVEVSDQAAELTRAGLAERGIETAEVVVTDAHALDFEDDSFDVAHAHMVLHHLADPVTAIREMLRVTKPGGLVSLRECDYGGFVWWPAMPELDRWLELFGIALRANGGEPDAGRRLYAWAREAGADRIAATASTWCYTGEDALWWGDSWADRISGSALAAQLIELGREQAELDVVAEAWRAWARHGDAWYSVLSAELIITVA